jgi:chaperonin GroES
LIRAIGENVLIKPIKPNDKTNGGLTIPEIMREIKNEGIVITIGDKVTEIKQNDKVIYQPYGQVPLKYEGEEYLLFKKQDILAIIEE